jgi:hypothetical protein
MPVTNNLTGGNIFEDAYGLIKNEAKKIPGVIGDAIIKNKLISKGLSYVPVVGKPVSDIVSIFGLGKKNKKLMGKGITTIRRNKRNKKIMM